MATYASRQDTSIKVAQIFKNIIIIIIVVILLIYFYKNHRSDLCILTHVFISDVELSFSPFFSPYFLLTQWRLDVHVL